MDMNGENDALKQQFQLLQEQQQKKLQRRKERKEQKVKTKENDEAPSFGVEDNLGLKLAEPVPKNSSYLSEELVEHLNQQIRELKDENGRVYKLLSEKDFELRNLKKKKEGEKAGMGGITNETAASKIVELSKKVRELSAEMESERTKAKQYARKCQELNQRLSSIPEDTRSTLGSAISLRSQFEEKPSEPEVDIKGLQDKLKQMENKMTEYRNNCSQLKQELKITHKVLAQEVGDNVNAQSLLNANSNWRGRSQQILALTKKVEDLKAQLNNKSETDYENDMIGLGSGTARRRTADERYREKLRKQEKERKEAQEKQTQEFAALEADYEALKKKFDAAKTRNKVLANEIKPLKQQMQTLVEKGQHDDELISALFEQQSKLKEMLEKDSQIKKETVEEKEAKLKMLAMKSQHDSNIVEQLKVIVAEKESKVHMLEDEIKQLKLNHIQKAQEESVNQLFQQTDNRPPSSLPSSRPETANENVELGFVLSSVTPSQSRMSDRPPSGISDRPSTYNLTDRPPTVNSSRPSSRKNLKTPTNNNPDTQILAELKYQCQEANTLMQASDVEREKLSELVKVLQGRLNEQTEKLTELQNDLVQQRRKNALLEKQVGKSRVEQQNQLIKTGSGIPKSSRGRSSVSGSMSGNPLTTSMSGKDMMGLVEEDNADNMNVEELRTNLEIQRDENKALKTALQSTLQAKEEDLSMYYEMMEETKKVFLQALRQYKQNIHVT